jgi:excisionase family DNA binding protein
MTWKKIRDAAQYIGMSERTVRELLKQGLPHSRLPSGTVLVELEQIDEWLRDFSVDRQQQAVIQDLLSGMK